MATDLKLRESDSGDLDMSIPPEDDEFSLETVLSNGYDWSHLDSLAEEVGGSIVRFAVDIDQVVKACPIKNLNDADKDEMSRLVESFSRDITNASGKLKEIRAEHAGKKGPLTSLEDMPVYDDLFMRYSVISTEFMTIISPSIAGIMLLASKASSANDVTKEIEEFIGEEEVEDGKH